MPTNLLGVIFALTTSFAWGAGDFTGGLTSRRCHQCYVLALGALSGLAVLIAVALVLHESFPAWPGLLWGMAAGLAGALGLLSLYRALATGHAACVAPTAGVIGAALPVAFGILTNGLPPATRLAGVALALLGIWLVAHAAHVERSGSRRAFLLACLAGLGFGCNFILLGQVEPGKVFTPLILARSMTLLTALVLIRSQHLALPGLNTNPTALLCGVLDAGGNVFYMLAKQYVRLDVAAVLASLYPASTVMLAGIVLKERMSRSQGLGVVSCLLAIALITL